MTTTNLKDALTEAFNARGFDAPTYSDVPGGVMLHWGRDQVTVWAEGATLCYSLPNYRMTRQGGRLEAIRAAAKSMGLDYREES